MERILLEIALSGRKDITTTTIHLEEHEQIVYLAIHRANVEDGAVEIYEGACMGVLAPAREIDIKNSADILKKLYSIHISLSGLLQPCD